MGYVKRREIESLEPREEPPTEVLGWVPVLDKWPLVDEWVLVSRLGGRLVCEAQHKGKGTFMRGESEVHPTHWMPLPEPPIVIDDEVRALHEVARQIAKTQHHEQTLGDVLFKRPPSPPEVQ